MSERTTLNGGDMYFDNSFILQIACIIIGVLIIVVEKSVMKNVFLETFKMNPEVYGVERIAVQQEVDIVILQYQAELDEKSMTDQALKEFGHSYATVVSAAQRFGYRIPYEDEYREWYS